MAATFLYGHAACSIYLHVSELNISENLCFIIGKLGLFHHLSKIFLDFLKELVNMTINIVYNLPEGILF